jgi:hypothetical protein
MIVMPAIDMIGRSVVLPGKKLIFRAAKFCVVRAVCKSMAWLVK